MSLQTSSNTVAVSSLVSSADTERIVVMLQNVVKSIVERPEAVFVSAVESGSDVTLTVDVALEDIGKVLGKQGRTARSLRTILGAAAAPLGRTYSLNIPEKRSFTQP